MTGSPNSHRPTPALVVVVWLALLTAPILVTGTRVSGAAAQPVANEPIDLIDFCLGVDHFPDEPAAPGAPSKAWISGSLPPEFGGDEMLLVLEDLDGDGLVQIERTVISSDGTFRTDYIPIYQYGSIDLLGGAVAAPGSQLPPGVGAESIDEIFGEPIFTPVNVDSLSGIEVTEDEVDCSTESLVTAPPTTSPPEPTTTPPPTTSPPETAPEPTEPPTTASPVPTTVAAGPSPVDTGGGNSPWAPLGLGTGLILVVSGIFLATRRRPVASNRDENDPPRRSVIFVPGIMASSVEFTDTRGQSHLLWPPFGYGTDVKTALETMQATDPARLRPRTGAWNGLLPGIHTGLLSFLESHGYHLSPTDGTPPNLYVFSYNWMLSCDRAGKALAALVARATAEHGRSPSIIAHSMGGLVTRAAAMRHGARFDQAFYVASPHLGAPMAYYSLHPDIPYSFLPGLAGTALNAAYAVSQSEDATPAALKLLAGPVVSKAVSAAARAYAGSDAFDEHMKLVSQNATGVYELIPDELYFTNVNPRWPVVTHKKRWYRRSGYYERHDHVPTTAAEAYRRDGNKDITGLPPHMAAGVTAALAFKASISGPLPPGGEDRTFVIYGKGHDTPCEAVMTDDGPADERGDVDCELGGDQGGDGTVPTESGRGEPLWGSGVTVERDDTAEHFMMTETPRLHGILSQYLPRGDT